MGSETRPAGPGAALLAALLCAPLVLAGLGRNGLNEPDEGRNAEVAREMVASGDLVTPRINDAVYLDKPPLYFWVVGASLATLGTNEFAARLPSALAALAAVALTFGFARRRFGTKEAWCAAFVLALTPLYLVFARLVIFDMLLLLCTTVSILAAYRVLEEDEPDRRAALLVFAAGAAGTLVKGPVALLMPLAVAIVWAIVRRAPGRLKRLGWGAGLALYAAMVLPWLLLVEHRHPGYLRYAIIGENLGRVTSDTYETARPFFFYTKVVLPGLFPWIVLVLAAGVAALGRRRRGRLEPQAADAVAARFCGVWLATVYLFFSLIASKRPSYVLPCAVPAALLAGRLIVRGASEAAARRDRAAGAWAAAAGCVVLAAAAWLSPYALESTSLAGERHAPLLHQTALFNATGVGLLAAACLLAAVRRTASPALFLLAAAAPFAVCLPLAAAASRQVEVARSSRTVSAFLAERLRPGDRVVCFEEYRPGLNFYLKRPIWQVTHMGRVFTSNYIATHLDDMRRDPGFRLMPPDDFRARLREAGAATYVLVPKKENDRLAETTGMTFRPLWEGGGFELDVPASPDAAGPAPASPAPAGL